jgi:hypothetical protein
MRYFLGAGFAAALVFASASAHAHHNDKKGHAPAYAEKQISEPTRAAPSEKKGTQPARKHRKRP